MYSKCDNTRGLSFIHRTIYMSQHNVRILIAYFAIIRRIRRATGKRAMQKDMLLRRQRFVTSDDVVAKGFTRDFVRLNVSGKKWKLIFNALLQKHNCTVSQSSDHCFEENDRSHRTIIKAVVQSARAAPRFFAYSADRTRLSVCKRSRLAIGGDLPWKLWRRVYRFACCIIRAEKRVIVTSLDFIRNFFHYQYPLRWEIIIAIVIVVS